MRGSRRCGVLCLPRSVWYPPCGGYRGIERELESGRKLVVFAVTEDELRLAGLNLFGVMELSDKMMSSAFVLYSMYCHGLLT